MMTSPHADRSTLHAVKRISAKLEKFEGRIRSLEDDRLKVKAWAALIVFAGSVAAYIIGRFWPQ